MVKDDQDSMEILAEYLGMKEIKVVAKDKDRKETVEFSKLKPEEFY